MIWPPTAVLSVYALQCSFSRTWHRVQAAYLEYQLC
jgi:hypothetical protein